MPQKSFERGISDPRFSPRAAPHRRSFSAMGHPVTWHQSRSSKLLVKLSNKYQSPETCSCSSLLLFFFNTLSNNVILLISTGNWHTLEQIRMHVLPRGGIRWTWMGQVARCTSSFREQLHISLDTVRRCPNWFRPTSGCVSQCFGTSAKS